MNIKTWIDYGRELAEKHTAILHADAQNRKAFQVIDVEEAFGDIKSLTGDVAVRWFIPTYNIPDPGGSPQKIYQAGFLILAKHSRGNTDAYIDAIVKAEQIADQFLTRIRHDSQEDSLLFLGGQDSLEDMSITGIPMKGGLDTSYSGWVVTLRVMSPFEQDCIGSNWSDL